MTRDKPKVNPFSKDQYLEVLVTIASSPRGRSLIEQIQDRLGQSLEESSHSR